MFEGLNIKIMKKCYLLVLIFNLCFSKFLSAQKVSNISAEQLGQSIQVSYNLETELPCSVSLYYSTDNGAKWQGPLKNVAGDVGEKIISGNKKIIWDVLFEVEQLKYEGVVFKIQARLNDFKEVKIGNQIWSAENLNTDRFANGSYILQAKNSEEWKRAGEKQKAAWCYYENNISNDNLYGKLYNFYAVADPRGLCPTGWHVPSDDEWTKLETYLVASSVVGGRLKEIGITHWASPNKGADNRSGYTGLPGGYRDYNGPFEDVGNYGYWWSNTQYSPTGAFNRYLVSSYSAVYRGYYNMAYGFSVRCVKD
jgi:uncharacterized protein (TIGR02145 family)